MSDSRKQVSICADDFGCSVAVSRGIVELALRGRLSAISCLTGGRRWPDCAPMLADVPTSVERGLHFNLTDGTPSSAELRLHWPRFPALRRLIALAHLGWLPLEAITKEWQAQWEHFVDITGATPRFVDGHQHVHHLPGVRDVLLAGVMSAGAPVAVRNTGRVLGPGNALKRMLIEHTGGTVLERQLLALGVRHNRALLGVYDFRDPDYRRRLRRWLASAPPEGALLFCHPGGTGVVARDEADAIGPARLREGEYLRSAAFEDDLVECGVTLGPAWT